MSQVTFTTTPTADLPSSVARTAPTETADDVTERLVGSAGTHGG